MGDDSKRSMRSSVVEHGNPQTEKKARGKDSHISSSSDNDFQDFVRKSLTSNKSALDDVAQKLNQVLANQTALENRLTDLEPKVVKNSSDIRDITQSLDFESDRVTTVEKTISVMQQELNAQSRELHTMSTAMVNLQSQVLDLERYTRGYNIRIFGVNESQGEVCKEKVDRILADKFAVESAIENAHRTGKAESGRPRPIIARFYSRFTRRAVMRVAKEKLHNTNIRFVDDLTKTDLEEKNRLKPFMAELYEKGKKPRFVQGRLYSNNTLITQNEIKTFFDNQ